MCVCVRLLVKKVLIICIVDCKKKYVYQILSELVNIIF